MEIELSVGKILLKDLTWGEENDCYEAAEIHGGLIKNSIFYRHLEQKMTGKSKEWLDKLSKEDGSKLREAVKNKFESGDSSKK
jgi:hypothetical protein